MFDLTINEGTKNLSCDATVTGYDLVAELVVTLTTCKVAQTYSKL